MSDNQDFIIENGVLKQYAGPGGDVAIPEGVTEIAAFCFEHCDTLTRAALPESVQRISLRAFYDCRNLREVVFSRNLSSVGEAAFDCCEKLGRFVVPEDNETFQVKNGLLMSGDTLAVCPGGMRGACQIPEGTVRIARYAFAGCHKLTAVRIPDSVTSIGDHAFWYCGAHLKLTLPPALKIVARKLCCGCGNLKEVVIPASVRSIEDSAFKECGLRRVSLLGKSVKMDGYVFGEGDFELSAPNLPLADLKPIYRMNAFQGFFRAEAEGKPFPPERRAEYLAYLKTNRKKFFPMALERPELLRLMLKEEMFSSRDAEQFAAQAAEAGRTEITAALLDYQNRLFPLEERLEAQERRFKRQSKQLERDLELLESGGEPEQKQPKLWRYEKDEKGNLTILGYKGEEDGVEVPAAIGKNPVTAIGEYACSPNGKPLTQAQRAARHKIRSIRLPEGIVAVGGSAFEDCEGLERVELPASLRKLEGSSYVFGAYKPPKRRKTEDPFCGCTALRQVHVAEGNRWYCVQEGLLCRKSRDGQKMLRCVENLEGCCTVPEGTAELPYRAFAGCQKLTEVILPASLKKIGEEAFQNCAHLKRVTMQAGVSQIHYNAFEGCGKLTIRAPSGSFAEEYAKKRRIPFEAL